MIELAQHLMGIKLIVSPRLKGGIPEYDIIEGEKVEVGRIHAMKVDEQLLVSEELYAAIERGDFNESKRD